MLPIQGIPPPVNAQQYFIVKEQTDKFEKFLKTIKFGRRSDKEKYYINPLRYARQVKRFIALHCTNVHPQNIILSILNNGVQHQAREWLDSKLLAILQNPQPVLIFFLFFCEKFMSPKAYAIHYRQMQQMHRPTYVQVNDYIDSWIQAYGDLVFLFKACTNIRSWPNPEAPSNLSLNKMIIQGINSRKIARELVKLQGIFLLTPTSFSGQVRRISDELKEADNLLVTTRDLNQLSLDPKNKYKNINPSSKLNLNDPNNVRFKRNQNNYNNYNQYNNYNRRNNNNNNRNNYSNNRNKNNYNQNKNYSNSRKKNYKNNNNSKRYKKDDYYFKRAPTRKPKHNFTIKSRNFPNKQKYDNKNKERRPRRCFICGSEKHLANKCPDAKGDIKSGYSYLMQNDNKGVDQNQWFFTLGSLLKERS